MATGAAAGRASWLRSSGGGTSIICGTAFRSTGRPKLARPGRGGEGFCDQVSGRLAELCLASILSSTLLEGTRAGTGGLDFEVGVGEASSAGREKFIVGLLVGVVDVNGSEGVLSVWARFEMSVVENEGRGGTSSSFGGG